MRANKAANYCKKFYLLRRTIKEILLKIFLSILFISFPIAQTKGQDLVQNIRGRVVDIHTNLVLPGSNVIIIGNNLIFGTVSDNEGHFVLNNIPIGRYILSVSYVGYKTFEATNIYLTTGKEVFIEIKLEESVEQIDELVITATVDKDRPLNPMAAVSARMFTIDETKRYAGSDGDPARMALNFAGVNTLNDQSNDLVIRGNSPFGLLWVLEGVEIPNPNHFGAHGATGGPISMLNNNALNNSDFFTGAFPAQYGNALSGVFDLTMRQGNITKYEFMGQIAFNGFEFGVEGPISRKNNTSFLANYRYSSLALIIDIIGNERLGIIAVPYYQDLSFKATIYRGVFGQISTFGLLGFNSIGIEEDAGNPDSWNHKLYGIKFNMLTYNGSTGIKHSIGLGNRAKLETTLATTYMSFNNNFDTLTRDNLAYNPQLRLNQKESTLFISSRATFKLNASNIFWIGATFQPIRYVFIDSLYQRSAQGFITRSNLNGLYSIAKAYFQWRYNYSDNISVRSGINIMYFTGNKKFSIEPRLGIRWEFYSGQALSLGSGLHAQLLPRIYYVAESIDTNGESIRLNKDLDYCKSIHLVFGYDKKIGVDTRMKIEAYYQNLFKIPVMEELPAWSVLNSGADWEPFIIPKGPLQNMGKGENLGFEFTLEKFFSSNYYFLVTASLYNSKYRGYDGIKRNSAFNGNYIFNFLAGKDFTLKKNRVISVDAKVTWAGGKRILPFHSQQIDEYMHIRVDDWENAYLQRMDDYFRVNLRLGYRINLLKTTHELALDLYNLTNHKNIFTQLFDPITGEVYTIYQFPFIPKLLYRFQF